MEKLSTPLICLTLSHVIDDMASVDGYLSDEKIAPSVESCIPRILRDFLQEYNTNIVAIPTADQTIVILQILWSYQDDPDVALVAAAKHRITAIIPFLLSVNTYSVGTVSEAMDQAILNDDTATISALFKSGLIDSSAVLSYAVHDGKLLATRELINLGASPISNPTILLYPVATGNLSMVKLLIKNGARIQDYTPQTLFYDAVSSGNTALIDYLKSLGISGNVDSAFFAAAQGANVPLMKEYLVRDEKILPKYCITAMRAALQGVIQDRDVSAVNYLKELCCTYDHLDVQLINAAANAGDAKLLDKELRETAIMPRELDQPLGWAAGHGHADIVELLLKKMFAILPGDDVIDNIIGDALRSAASADYASMVRIFVPILIEGKVTEVELFREALYNYISFAIKDGYPGVVAALLPLFTPDQLEGLMKLAIHYMVYRITKHADLVVAVMMQYGVQFDQYDKYTSLDATGKLVQLLAMTHTQRQEFIDRELAATVKPEAPRYKL